MLNSCHCNMPVHERDSVFLLYTPGELSALVDISFTTFLAILWTLDDRVIAASYAISYCNTNTECFTACDNIAASETMYTLTNLQEATEYSITVTALLSDGGSTEDRLIATTMSSGK